MDETLKAARAMLVAATLAVVAGGAAAEQLADPTRPPARLSAPAPGPAGGADGVPQLQSVLIGEGTSPRRVAVIDGVALRQGDRWQGARVALIAPDQVVLVRGHSRQVLRLAGPAADGVQKTVAGLK